VREAAKQDGKRKFTALLHHVIIDLLRERYYSLKKQAAPGVDGVTWQEYGQDLEARLSDLHGRVHRGSYHAQPSRRVWCPEGTPKADGRQRPSGIAALEDKIVQYAVGTVLNQIWEEDFLGFTHICGTSHKTGYFTVRRKTIGKRMAAELKDIRAKLRQPMHVSPATTGKWLAPVVRGYFQYHAIPGNWARLKAFHNDVLRIWFRTLRRRSQRSRLSWHRFLEGLGSLLPPIRILQPYPSVRFDAKHPNIRGRNRVR
jgi:hypothetical protein